MRHLSAFKMAPPLADGKGGMADGKADGKAAAPPEPSMVELPYTGQVS